MKSQLSIFDYYPHQPGYKREGTSKAAARQMRNKAPSLRDRALEVLQRFEMNVDEIAHALNVSPLALRPRITELFRMGKIRDTGNLRSNDSGKLAIVWGIK